MTCIFWQIIVSLHPVHIHDNTDHTNALQTTARQLRDLILEPWSPPFGPPTIVVNQPTIPVTPSTPPINGQIIALGIQGTLASIGAILANQSNNDQEVNTTTDRNLPTTGDPNSSLRRVDEQGRVIQERQLV